MSDYSNKGRHFQSPFLTKEPQIADGNGQEWHTRRTKWKFYTSCSFILVSNHGTFLLGCLGEENERPSLITYWPLYWCIRIKHSSPLVMGRASLISRRGSLAGEDERGEAKGYWCEKGQQILMQEVRGSTKPLGCGWGEMDRRQHAELWWQPLEWGNMGWKVADSVQEIVG